MALAPFSVTGRAKEHEPDTGARRKLDVGATPSRSVGATLQFSGGHSASSALEKLNEVRELPPFLAGRKPDAYTAACMGFSLSSGFRAAISLSCFLYRFLCSIWNPVSSAMRL
jgi:hypothetical protein